MEISNFYSAILYKFSLTLLITAGTKLLEELEHFESVVTHQLKLQIHRPNSMNNYGIILGSTFESNLIIRRNGVLPHDTRSH